MNRSMHPWSIYSDFPVVKLGSIHKPMEQKVRSTEHQRRLWKLTVMGWLFKVAVYTRWDFLKTLV